MGSLLRRVQKSRARSGGAKDLTPREKVEEAYKCINLLSDAWRAREGAREDAVREHVHALCTRHFPGHIAARHPDGETIVLVPPPSGVLAVPAFTWLDNREDTK